MVQNKLYRANTLVSTFAEYYKIETISNQLFDFCACSSKLKIRISLKKHPLCWTNEVSEQNKCIAKLFQWNWFNLGEIISNQIYFFQRRKSTEIHYLRPKTSIGDIISMR